MGDGGQGDAENPFGVWMDAAPRAELGIHLGPGDDIDAQGAELGREALTDDPLGHKEAAHVVPETGDGRGPADDGSVARHAQGAVPADIHARRRADLCIPGTLAARRWATRRIAEHPAGKAG
jgi:hypothetical protein